MSHLVFHETGVYGSETMSELILRTQLDSSADELLTCLHSLVQRVTGSNVGGYG